jgi:hypothetical protein
MLAAAFLTVNALGCTPVRRVGPERESRPWPAHLLVPALAPSAAETLAAEPVRLWSAHAGRGFAGPPAIGDSVIAVQTTDSRLVALSRSTGKQIWQVRVDGLGASGPLLGPDAVYTATVNGQASATSLHTGRSIWKRTLQPLVGPLALDPKRLFTATASGRVYALDRGTGGIGWRHDLEAPLRSGPTLMLGRVVVATDDSIFQLDPGDGHRLGARAMHGVALNPPAVWDTLLVYSSPDGFLAALNASDLTPVWKTNASEGFMGSAVVARDTVFAISIGGTIWKVPLATPAAPVRIDLGVPVRASPTPLADGLLVATIPGEILRLTGSAEPSWKVRADAPLEQPPIVDRGSLIFLDGRGRIHAWR